MLDSVLCAFEVNAQVQRYTPNATVQSIFDYLNKYTEFRALQLQQNASTDTFRNEGGLAAS